MLKDLRALLVLSSALAVVCSAPAFCQDKPDATPATSATAGNSGEPIADPTAAHVASAAPSRSAADPGMGDIVVTARRSEELLQDVPISITVLNQQQLSSRNVVVAADLATYTPSLSANNYFGSSNTVFAIRGFNQQIGTSPTVGLYFADVISPRGASNNLPIGDGAGPGSFFDLQNVQILKGPQGTLFGLNTTGGSILLVPQKPTDKFEGYVEGSYGTYNMRQIQGVLNVPLGADAAFRIGVDHQDRDGYLKNTGPIGPRAFADLGYTAVRASLDVRLSPEIENYTIGSFLRSDTNGDLQKLYLANPAFGFFGVLAQQQLASFKGGFFTTQNTQPDPSTKLTQWQIINTTTVRLNDDLTIKNIASYSQLKEDLNTELFGSYLDLYQYQPAPGVFPYRAVYQQPNVALIGLANVYPTPGGHTANQANVTEEVQLQGNAFANRLTYQGGFYFENSTPLGLQGSQSQNLIFCQSPSSIICANPIGAGSDSITNGRTSFRDIAVYAQGTYSLTDQLKLTGGFRYTWDKQRTSGQQYAYRYNIPPGIVPGFGTFTAFFPSAPIGLICTNPNSTPPGCVVAYHERSSAPTWLIDLDYKPTRDVLVYAKYSRGYRAGGISPTAPTQFAFYKPEKLDAYEAGLKTTFRGALKATFNVSAFYNKFKNEQLSSSFYAKVTGSLPAQSGTVNADKSRSYGVEVEGTISPFAGFTLDGSYAYNNAKVLRIPPVVTAPDSPYFALSAARSGDREQFTPRHKLSVTGTYVFPLDTSSGRLSIGATYSYSSSQVVQYASRDASGRLTNQSILEPRNIVDVNMNWNSVLGSPFDLQFFATNVTNLKYYTLKTGLINAVGFDTAIVGPPRMIGGRVRFHFGA